MGEWPIFHSSSSFYDQVIPLSDFKFTNTFVPGGTSGVGMQSNGPKWYGHAESLGSTLDFLSKFKVNIACGNRQSNYLIGKSGSKVTKLVFKWFLKKCISCSDLFVYWIFGGTNWSQMNTPFNAYLKRTKDSLSII